MKYYILNITIDGVYFEEIEEKNIIKEIEEYTEEQEDMGKKVKFLTNKDMDGIDPSEWEEGILIIKGEIVIPKPKKIVKTWEID